LSGQWVQLGLHYWNGIVPSHKSDSWLLNCSKVNSVVSFVKLIYWNGSVPSICRNWNGRVPKATFQHCVGLVCSTGTAVFHPKTAFDKQSQHWNGRVILFFVVGVTKV
jgi:hypothetical protein